MTSLPLSWLAPCHLPRQREASLGPLISAPLQGGCREATGGFRGLSRSDWGVSPQGSKDRAPRGALLTISLRLACLSYSSPVVK